MLKPFPFPSPVLQNVTVFGHIAFNKVIRNVTVMMGLNFALTSVIIRRRNLDKQRDTPGCTLIDLRGDQVKTCKKVAIFKPKREAS